MRAAAKISSALGDVVRDADDRDEFAGFVQQWTVRDVGNERRGIFAPDREFT
jgi:hypothetical protein